MGVRVCVGAVGVGNGGGEVRVKVVPVFEKKHVVHTKKAHRKCTHRMSHFLSITTIQTGGKFLLPHSPFVSPHVDDSAITLLHV